MIVQSVPKDTAGMRAAIVAIVVAIEGESREVTTEKRRGYWYAFCGGRESGKGRSGLDGEYLALRALLEVVSEWASPVARTLLHHATTARRLVVKAESNKGYVASAVKRLEAAKTDLEAALRYSDDSIAAAKKANDAFEAAAIAATERECAVYAALVASGVMTT